MSELKDLLAMKNALDGGTADASRILSPAQEVETSLVVFLKHRLEKLQEVASFEDTIKDAILARIPEASFSQLMSLLDLTQRNNNDATGRVLLPFISSAGKTLPESIRDSQASNRESPADKIYETTEDKSVLQAMHAIQLLMGKINAAKADVSEAKE